MQRPASVKTACYLLWAALAIAIVSLIPGIRNGFWESNEGSPVFVAGFLAIAYLAMALLVLMTYRGKNWARWLFAVLAGIGWLSLLGDLSSLLAQGAFAVVLELAITLIEIYALFLLFSRASQPWFSKSA